MPKKKLVKKQKSLRKYKKYWWIIVLIFLFGIGTIFFIKLQKNQIQPTIITKITEPTPIVSPKIFSTETPTPTILPPWTDSESEDMNTWKTYHSELDEGLHFKYPPTWTITQEKREYLFDNTIFIREEVIHLQTPSKFTLTFVSSNHPSDGGCPECTVNYVEKITIPNFKNIFIVENDRGINSNVLYVTENETQIGDKKLDWSISSKFQPDTNTRHFSFIGQFENIDPRGRQYGGHEYVLSPEIFSSRPEVQTARKILRTIRY
ncbi:MAG TPA: hypothetical protein VLF20_03105 [Patescibacteria group bacterium]|nr:hypothetical protein [Patescibacteria group bacterium]